MGLRSTCVCESVSKPVRVQLSTLCLCSLNRDQFSVEVFYPVLIYARLQSHNNETRNAIPVYFGARRDTNNALDGTNAIIYIIVSHKTSMPVSVALERADDNDPSNYKFIVSVSFSFANTAQLLSKTVSMVECTSADVEKLYSRTTGGVLRALQISDWRCSQRVRKYKQCIRIALPECDVRSVFSDCSQALHRAVARTRGYVRCVRTDESCSERTYGDQEMFSLANSLPLAQRNRFLSMFT